MLVLSQSTKVGDTMLIARMYDREDGYDYYFMVDGSVRHSHRLNADSYGTASDKFDLLFQGHIKRFREEEVATR